MAKKSRATKKAAAQRAAERAATIRRQQDVRERRRRATVVTLAVLVVLTVIVGLVAAFQASRDTTGQAAEPPSGVVQEYAVPDGSLDAPVTVEVYEDFMCPFCGQFEAAAGERLKELAASGDVQVHYWPLAFLDRVSEGTEYSTRAANAVGVVLDAAGPEAAVRMHGLLFANQPAEGTPGLDDDRLIELAVEAGAQRAAVEQGIRDREFEGWVKNGTDAASRGGINGTPTVLVDGVQLEFTTLDELRVALDDAVAEALKQ